MSSYKLRNVNNKYCHEYFTLALLPLPKTRKKQNKLEMWANTQRNGRPAEYRWRPLFNAATYADAQYSSAVQ